MKISSLPNKVVVTGLGLVTSLGNDGAHVWQALVSGTKGGALAQAFPIQGWPNQVSCEVRDFCLDPRAILESHLPLLNRMSRFAMQASFEAMYQAFGFDDLVSQQSLESHNMGASIGCGIGAVTPEELLFSVGETIHDFPDRVYHRHTELLSMRNHPGSLAALLASRYRLGGPVSTIQTACASSGQALGEAYRTIKRGRADRMLVVGADSLAAPLHTAGFTLIGALSKRNFDPPGASRPFDRERDGFVPGEGGAALVIETEASALLRGAPIFAEIVGYGETLSAYRITDLPPDARGVYEAMVDSLDQAGIKPPLLDYVNLHGTSTELNDRVEALAIRRLYSDYFPKSCAVSSTKSMTGHLISGAGALEAAICVMALYHQVVPPSANVQDTDCAADLDLVRDVGRKQRIRYAMSNSIGFGGSNSSLLFKRYNTAGNDED